jgi:hypothetical protein
VPGIRELEEKELCASPPAALGHDDGPGGCGAVFLGGLRLGPLASVAALTTTTTTKMPDPYIPCEQANPEMALRPFSTLFLHPVPYAHAPMAKGQKLEEEDLCDSMGGGSSKSFLSLSYVQINNKQRKLVPSPEQPFITAKSRTFGHGAHR